LRYMLWADSDEAGKHAKQRPQARKAANHGCVGRKERYSIRKPSYGVAETGAEAPPTSRECPVRQSDIISEGFATEQVIVEF
jgi:hypothetical protein